MQTFRGNLGMSVLIWLAPWLFPSQGASQSVSERMRIQLTKTELLVKQGRFNDGLKTAQMARSFAPQAGNAPDTLLAKTFFWLGRCCALLIQESKALLYFDSARLCLATDNNALFHLIQGYSGLLQKDASKIRASLAYFDAPAGKNGQLYAETLLSLITLQLRTKADSTTRTLLVEGLSTLVAIGQGASLLAGRYYQALGFYDWKTGKQPQEALDHFRKAEAIYLLLGGTGSNYLAALYLNMGGCLDEIGFPRKALECYKVVETNLMHQDEHHPFLINLYNNMGTSYQDFGEYSLSIRYLEKVIDLAPESGKYWNNLGDAYLANQKWNQAEACFKKALELLQQTNKPEDQARIARPYHNLALIYRHRGQHNRALEYELRSLPYRKSDSKDLLGIARTYLGMGKCYFDLGQYQACLNCLDSALLLQRTILPSLRHAETADAYSSKSSCLALMSNYPKALVLADSALYASGFVGGGNMNDVIAPPEMLAALEQKAGLHFSLFKKTNVEDHLVKAVQVYDTAAQAVRFFRNMLLENESKASLAGQFRSILSGGVEASLVLYRLHPTDVSHLNMAFAFSEQSKALVLLEGVRSAGAVKFAGIPDSILAQERLLRQSVTELEVALKKISEKNTAQNDPQLIVAKNMLFDRQRDFEGFQRMLSTGIYQAYYAFRYGFKLVTAAEIQAQLLPSGGTMLSYFVGKNNHVTAFVIQKDGMYAVDCPSRGDLDSLVAAMRFGLFGYYGLSPSKRNDAIFESTLLQFIHAGQALYSQLLEPVDHLLSGEVIIVPDGCLSNIPFELLLTGPPVQMLHFGSYPYWFKEKNRSISYVYSATLLREMIQKQHAQAPSKVLFAMAPFFPGNKEDVISGKPFAALTMRPISGSGGRTFKPLPYSGEELRDICTLWNSTYEVGKTCTKSRFLQAAPDYQVVHLSTHGVLDSTPDFSFLAFAPSPGELEADPLYIRDLYNLQLNADLVTLSACETGVGEFQRGEGVISLARAFAYAGAKSIVTTLWQVDNASTQDLMSGFYNNLKAGKPKNKALQEAKLNFIKMHSGEQQHPFFWAGLVGVGDMRPLAPQ